jgi:hypothetical protein
MVPGYTKEDLKILGSITDTFLNSSDNSYYDLMVKVMEEESDVLQCILEFIGNYLLTINKQKAYELLKENLFTEDLSVFPLLLNSSEQGWKTIIARWRLKIGK